MFFEKREPKILIINGDITFKIVTRIKNNDESFN